MSANRSSGPQDAALKTVAERRRNVRFPIRLPVRYTLGKIHGWGRIVNIGSGGALLTVDHPARPGQHVALSIAWPVLLHEKVHLNLVAEGIVIRVEDGRAAVRFERCHFRTATAAFRREALLPQWSGGASAHG